MAISMFMKMSWTINVASRKKIQTATEFTSE
jgi:hypothetical protein